MKTHNTIIILTLFAIALLGCVARPGAAATIFNADFEGSAVGGDTGKTNLDAGTSVGDWTVGAEGGEHTGVRASGGNQAAAFDRVAPQWSYTANMGSTEALSGGITVSLDLHALRQNGAEKLATISGIDAANQPFFTVTVDETDTSNPKDIILNGGSTINGVQLQAGSFVNDKLRTVTLELGATSYDVWLDADDDGVIDGGEQLTGISYLTTPTTGLAALSFESAVLSGSGSTGPGIMVDNINVDVVPEPSTLALAAFGLLGLIGFRRRKR